MGSRSKAIATELVKEKNALMAAYSPPFNEGMIQDAHCSHGHNASDAAEKLIVLAQMENPDMLKPDLFTAPDIRVRDIADELNLHKPVLSYLYSFTKEGKLFSRRNTVTTQVPQI